MPWIEYPGDVPGRPYAQIDLENSQVEGSDLQSVEIIPEMGKAVTYLLPNHDVSSIQDLLVLPNSQSCFLVRGAAKTLFEKLPDGEVAFVDAVIKARDGDFLEFKAVKPMIEKACTDLEASDIKWLVPGRFYTAWNSSVYYTEGCMGSCHVVREKFSKKLVVSDTLRQSLLEVASEYVDLIKPEKYMNLIRHSEF